MAINKNHEFEDLNGIKCAIVEKNALEERVEFLKKLLEYNRYTVIVAASPPPKAAAPVPAGAEIPAPPPAPTTFTIGVTDVMFNATNAILEDCCAHPTDMWLPLLTGSRRKTCQTITLLTLRNTN